MFATDPQIHLSFFFNLSKSALLVYRLLIFYWSLLLRTTLIRVQTL